ncbi:MAG: DotU family type IV/VI secretion system protein [Deltaproteobacteria bacterium]|nr:MAG: DotU family type IV/VI secretion system protein [Deltaproteobacteria bacterium]
MSSSPLVEAYSNLLAYICHLTRTLADNPPMPEDVRSRISNLLATGDQAAQAMGIQSADIRQARFALCAFIDERLMNESWPGRDFWKRSLLQTQYFQTTNAGEEFFSNLNALRPEQNRVREIYYLCLCMGFKGLHCKPDDKSVLAMLRETEFAAIKGLDQPGIADPAPLFPEGYPAGDKAESLLLRKGLSGPEKSHILLAVIPPGFFLILFLVYFFVLSGVSDDILGPVFGLR